MYINIETKQLEEIMKKIVLLISFMSVILVGCGDNKEEYRAFYVALETPINIESEIQEISAQYDALESEKSDYQDEVNTADRTRLAELSTLLQDNTAERAALVQEEREVMTESEESLTEIRTLAESIPVEEYQNDANELVELMEARYTAHEEMQTAIREMLSTEEALFETYANETLSQDDIDELLEELSEHYISVNESSEVYHASTSAVNQQRSDIMDTLNN